MSELLNVQECQWFFDPTPDHQYDWLPLPPTDQEIRLALEPNNQHCPLNQLIVGPENDATMKWLRLAAFSAYKHHTHSVRGKSFGIYSGPGNGKTTVVEAWAKTIGVPFVSVTCDDIKSLWQLWQVIKSVFEASGYPLVPQFSQYDYSVPPCIVFLDEVHSLPVSVRRSGGLLKAMEVNDGWMRITQNKNGPVYKIDCVEVCWIAATTDPAPLVKQSKAFYDRFTEHHVWQSPGPDEVARIVHGKYPTWPLNICKQIAYYEWNPRQAKAFGESVEGEAGMANISLAEAVENVARMKQFDEYGMHSRHLAILKSLAHKPSAREYLAMSVGCDLEELVAIWLPPLIRYKGGVSLLSPTHRGFALTQAGLAELNRRGIANGGDKILAENLG